MPFSHLLPTKSIHPRLSLAVSARVRGPKAREVERDGILRVEQRQLGIEEADLAGLSLI